MNKYGSTAIKRLSVKNSLTIASLALVSFISVSVNSYGSVPANSTSASTRNTTGTKIIIIDGGADLSHPKLQGFININLAELNGKAGTDNDSNGFVGDVAGWNAVSNDHVYMPDYVESQFTGANAGTASSLLDLYARVENGDSSAINQIKKNPKLLDTMSTLLDEAHATHVAGITQMNSENSVRIQSMNVFNASTPPANNSSNGSNIRSASFSFGRISNLLKRPPTSHPQGSFLDDRQKLQQLIDQQGQEEESQNAIVAQYIRATGAKVANLSLGLSKFAVRQHFEALWQQENKEAGRSLNTAPSATQQANMEFAIDGLYSVSEDGWNNFFRANPDTLFVVAAGNDGSATDAQAGDTEVNPVTPANSSATVDNVITVAAVDSTGLITDFSCFSRRYVNIGAPGKAIASLAPGGLSATMSGTSMAAPYVTGVAAHVRDLNPSLKPAEVIDLLERTGKADGSLQGKTTSGNIVDPQAAYAAAQGSRLNALNLAIASSVNMRRSFTGRMGPLSTLELGDGHYGQISLSNEIVIQALRKFDSILN